MEHYGKQVGIIKRSCSKCGGDLGDRYKKQRYCKSCHAENMRLNRPKHSELPYESRLKANCRAYSKVYLKRGVIKKQSCERCGNEQSQMHHFDYSKPLQVTWLCRICHLDLHKKLKNG